MKKLTIFVTAFFALLAVSSTKAQFSTGVDLVSSYVWRGIPQDRTIEGNPTLGSPNVQPYLSYTAGGFTIGSWASYGLMSNVKEVDLYATYAFSSAFALTLTDYNWNFSQSYFNYGSGTDHIFEATLAYTGPSSVPITTSVNTMLYGADKKPSDDTKQAFSTYAELGWQFNPLAKVFIGGVLGESNNYYTTGAAITNIGLKVTKSIEITDKFSLPLYGIVGTNPYSKNAFFVVGMTL